MPHALNVNILTILLVHAFGLGGVFGFSSTDYLTEEASPMGDQGGGGFGRHLSQVLQEVNVSTGCQKEVTLFLERLSEKEGWALEMFDATAKLPSGLFSGNAQQLGEYDQCVGISAGSDEDPDDPLMIHGKYCLVLADVSVRRDADAPPALTRLVNRMRGEDLLISSINDTGHFIPRFSTIHIGVCIPAGCSGSELETALNALKRSATPAELEIRISARDQMCFSKTQTKQLPLSTNNPDKNTIFTSLTSFSLGRNLKSLLQNKTEDLPCINGIRALCSLMLYLGHKIIILCMTPYNNRTLRCP